MCSMKRELIIGDRDKRCKLYDLTVFNENKYAKCTIYSNIHYEMYKTVFPSRQNCVFRISELSPLPTVRFVSNNIEELIKLNEE